MFYLCFAQTSSFNCCLSENKNIHFLTSLLVFIRIHEITKYHLFRSNPTSLITERMANLHQIWLIWPLQLWRNLSADYQPVAQLTSYCTSVHSPPFSNFYSHLVSGKSEKSVHFSIRLFLFWFFIKWENELLAWRVRECKRKEIF